MLLSPLDAECLAIPATGAAVSAAPILVLETVTVLSLPIGLTGVTLAELVDSVIEEASTEVVELVVQSNDCELIIYCP